MFSEYEYRLELSGGYSDGDDKGREGTEESDNTLNMISQRCSLSSQVYTGSDDEDDVDVVV